MALASLLEAVQDFLERGGNVLYLIMGVTFFMWALILERQWYFRRVFPREAQGVLETWRARQEHASWCAQQVRRQLVSQVRQGLDHSLGLVKTLVDSPQTAGKKRVTWYGRNEHGSQVATGVYFYRMTAPGFEMTRKMVLLQ